MNTAPGRSRAAGRRRAAIFPAALIAIGLCLAACLPGPAAAEDGAQPGLWFARGLAYDLGEGVPQSTPRAFAWYRLAAQAGMPEAEFNVGVMLDSGRGIPPDTARAATWYARAAAHGQARAAFNLAMLYADGEGVPRSPTLAAAWLRRAASSLPAAKARLAGVATAPPSIAGDESSRPDVATPIWPVSRARTGPGTVELVWTAGQVPAATQFFAEMRALDDAGSREVFAGFTETSSILSIQAARPGEYAWRVFTISGDGHEYAASAWARFILSPEDDDE